MTQGMATADKKSLFVNGGNGGQIVTTGSYAGIVEAPLGVPIHVQLNGFGSFSVELITDLP